MIAKPSVLLHLWRHECGRVFSDKLTNQGDKTWYDSTLDACSEKYATPEMLKVFYMWLWIVVAQVVWSAVYKH